MSEPLEPRIEIEKLKIFDEKGVELKGQTLSDLQQMQLSLDFNTRWTKRHVYFQAIFGIIVLLTFYVLVYYVIHNNVINNIVARCVN